MIFTKTSINDLDKIIAIENAAENLQYIVANSKAQHLHLIQDEDAEHLTLKSEEGKLIGYVILAGLTNAEKSIEFRRIVIHEKGKGYGRKAIQEIKKHCFNTLKCQRLWLDVVEDNNRAIQLYLSEGFKEDFGQHNVMINGVPKNLIIMSITAQEL